MNFRKGWLNFSPNLPSSMTPKVAGCGGKSFEVCLSQLRAAITKYQRLASPQSQCRRIQFLVTLPPCFLVARWKERALVRRALSHCEDPSPISSSRSNSLPKGPPPHTITLGVRASTSGFGRVGGDTHIQPMVKFVVLALDSCVTLGELPNASDLVSSSI